MIPLDKKKLVKWILKNEGQMVKALGEGRESCRIMVERITPGGNVCVRPAEISRETLEAIREALYYSKAAMHPEHRKILLSHYKQRLTWNEIQDKWGINPRRTARRLSEILKCVSAFLSLLPDEHLDEIRHALEG